LLKCRLAIEAFSGKTVNAVLQDFYAKVLLLTLRGIVCFDLSPNPLKEKRRRTPPKGQPPRERGLNKTYGLHKVKQLLKNLSGKGVSQDHIEQVCAELKEAVEYNRKGQHNPRKKDKLKARDKPSYRGV
jgi:hypothetical protein